LYQKEKESPPLYGPKNNYFVQVVSNIKVLWYLYGVPDLEIVHVNKVSIYRYWSTRVGQSPQSRHWDEVVFDAEIKFVCFLKALSSSLTQLVYFHDLAIGVYLLCPRLLWSSYFNKALRWLGLDMKIVTLPSFCILVFYLRFSVLTWIYMNGWRHWSIMYDLDYNEHDLQVPPNSRSVFI
jgi:hypothetical protein